MSLIDSDAVRDFLQDYQHVLCDSLADADGSGHNFANDPWTREAGGHGLTRIFQNGDVFEKAGVGFSEVHGNTLPPSATAARPMLVGRKWHAMGVSLVLHPNNPHVPTTHANVRFFKAMQDGEDDVWWFGGGFDLTPCYGYAEDCQHWHQQARDACQPFGATLYADFKSRCDKYFYLKHRNETRGIGGLFFDDFGGDSFEHAFGLMQSVARHFLPAYIPLVERRKNTPFSDAQKSFQCHRRGRYVEFNLVYDRGTLFGLQSGGRTESILMSMPPTAHWGYDYQAKPGSVEATLAADYLVARDWL